MQPLSTLKSILHDRGYNRAALHELGAFRGGPIDRVQAIAATDNPDPRSVLSRLFYLNVAVPADAAASALSPFPLSELIDRGVVGLRADGFVESVGAIIPIGELYTFRDFEPEESGHPLRPDHVLGVGMATSMLSALTVRTAIDRMLDLGTGQGFHAMVGAGHAQNVIATDISPRALAFAAWGLELNGITNVELREGDLFEAVKDEAPFDLIVSNPPFIISPPHDLVCLGGFSEGDKLVERVLRETPRHMADGGYACIACNWHHKGDDQFSARPRSWISGSGCDAWLIETRRETADEYIDQWIREARIEMAGSAAPITREQWVRCLSDLGAEHISLGVILLHKRESNRHWFRTDSLDMGDLNGEASDQIMRIFRNQTLIQERTDLVSLADLHLGLCQDHSLVQERQGTRGAGWSTTLSTLRQTSGFSFEINLDSHAAELLGFLDGITPSREIIAVMAKRLKSDPDHAVRSSGQFIKQMMAMGYLEPGE
jgi:methylase of polypeptide subunit release factors